MHVPTTETFGKKLVKCNTSQFQATIVRALRELGGKGAIKEKPGGHMFSFSEKKMGLMKIQLI